MKRLWTSIVGMPIRVDSGSPVGHLNGVLLNPETGKVIAYLVGMARVLVPVDIETWRKDAILITGRDMLASPTEILRIQDYGLRRCLFMAKTIYSLDGKRLGRLSDFTLDTATDSLVSITSKKSFLWMSWDERIFSYKDIHEITDNSIIISHEMGSSKVPAAA